MLCLFLASCDGGRERRRGRLQPLMKNKGIRREGGKKNVGERERGGAPGDGVSKHERRDDAGEGFYWEQPLKEGEKRRMRGERACAF